MLNETNIIKGGKADKLTIKDIAKKFGVTTSKIQAELTKGKKIEKEHTQDIYKAIEIAMDHLSEFPDYYTRLIKMEKQAELHADKIKVKENYGMKNLIKESLRKKLKYKD